ncbi:MAG: hypothetical protein QOF78_2997, partial [Phycisphaerales bacterium]|nr:hypothetical protein [Phycisphaerales bacterium]
MRVAVRTGVSVMFGLLFCVGAVARGADEAKPNLGAKPPEGAVILFDGKDVSKWVTRKGGQPAPWKIVDGAMVAGGGDIDTKEQFRDFDLHAEWRTPEPKPDQKGQARGNSGVYLLGTYEIQILESYGLEPLIDGAGSIYSQKPASVNAALPPMEWQSYDITFRGPRFDAAGKKTEKARVSVVWNGKKVQDNVEIDGPTRAGNTEETATGPIRLQDHGHAVQFRNIWLVPGKDSKEVAGAQSNAVAIFNGKDLTGWKQAGPGHFDVKDGELQSVDGMGLLWNEREMPEKFTLVMEFKTSRKEDNSGVFVRFPDPGNDPWVAVKQGYEVQICEGNEKQFTGSIYNLKKREDNPANAAKPPGEWNDYEISLDGQKITVRLNGRKVNEYTGDRTTPRGFIGLQNHDPKSKVSFRNIRLIDNTDGKPPAAKPAASAAGAATSQAAIELPAPKPIDNARNAGLVARYFKDVKNFADLEKAKQKPPFLSRIDEKLNFRSSKGQFYKTKLATDFAATWTGYLRIKKAGPATLSIRSDDDAKLFIGDKLVINNKVTGDSVMKDKTQDIVFAAGDYPIRIEYYNIGGPGGFQLALKNDEGKFPAINEAHFVHDAEQAKVDWDQAAWNKATWSYREWAQKYGQNYDKMDYGPFLASTIEVSEKNHALKGYAIHLGKEQEATIVFDTDLCRFAGGWTGGFLELTGVAFDGAHGTNPKPDGEFVFTAPQLPGALAGDYSDKLAKDPRPRPYGPLPREWAKYKGLHLNGDRVVLHYTVGDVDVYDAPWAKSEGESVVITRSIKLSKSDQPLTLLLDKPADDNPIQISTTSKDVQVKQQGGYRYLVFPPRAEATTYGIAINRGAYAAQAVAENVDDLLKPGAGRWTKPVITKGEVSKSTTQPYVLDTITVPEENPYQSWMRFGGLDFFADGRAALSTWSGDVWVVSGIDDKLDHLTWTRFATGLYHPMGLRIVDDTVYVRGRDQ